MNCCSLRGYSEKVSLWRNISFKNLKIFSNVPNQRFNNSTLGIYPSGIDNICVTLYLVYNNREIGNRSLGIFCINYAVSIHYCIVINKGVLETQLLVQEDVQNIKCSQIVLMQMLFVIIRQTYILQNKPTKTDTKIFSGYV